MKFHGDGEGQEPIIGLFWQCGAGGRQIYQTLAREAFQVQDNSAGE